MDSAKLKGYQEWIRAELDRCVDFWLKNGLDKVNGGVYTCLDRARPERVSGIVLGPSPVGSLIRPLFIPDGGSQPQEG